MSRKLSRLERIQRSNDTACSLDGSLVLTKKPGVKLGLGIAPYPLHGELLAATMDAVVLITEANSRAFAMRCLTLSQRVQPVVGGVGI